MATNLKPLPAWLSLDERTAARWPMDVAAFVQTQVNPAQIGVRVVDVSTHGCLLAIPGGMPLGRYVGLALSQSLVVEGWIAWSKGDHAGLDFAHPLLAVVLEQILSEHGHTPLQQHG
ncbi:MAG TPA: PilZ domain-containing protein [Sphingomicrobium sp.]|jgi:hypothetical protein